MNKETEMELIEKWRKKADATEAASWPEEVNIPEVLRACADELEAALQQQLNTSGESLLSWMLNNLLTDSQLDVRPPGMSHTLRYMSGETPPKPVVSESDLDVIALNAMRECWDAVDNSEPRSQASTQSRAKMQIIIRNALNVALGIKS